MEDTGNSERQLMAAAQSGDRTAFGKLMEAHAPRLMGLSIKLLASQPDAEDTVQEAFAAAWHSRRKFDLAQPLEPWLTKITVNKARDVLRRRKRQRFLTGRPKKHLEVPEDAPGPDTRVEDRLLLQEVRASIVRLPSRLREPFVLVLLEGWSQSDAASLLGISEKAVETRIYRARKMLKKKFQMK